MTMAHDTVIIVSDPPMPPEDHILCINPIMQNEPGEKFMLSHALRRPYPLGRTMNRKLREMKIKETLGSKNSLIAVKTPCIIIIGESATIHNCS